MNTLDHACVFARVGEERLLSVERLVRTVPALLGDALVACDLAYHREGRFLGLLLRLAPVALTPQRRDRLAFWTARVGGRVLAVGMLPPADRARLQADLERCELVRTGLSPAALGDACGPFFTEAGAPPARRRGPPAPALVMDVGGPGWGAARWLPDARVLFVAAPIAPPAGDVVALALRFPGQPQPLVASATVAETIAPAAATPGRPAGYALRLDDAPAALVAALAPYAAATPDRAADFAPRFPVGAPVKVTASDAAAPAPRATIEYASDQELAADFVENLSQGGAFVRTARPPPVGAPVALELKLPNGAALLASAVVANVSPHGMGVRFTLSPEDEAVLSAAIAHISARARRALVVDDDALVRRMLGDALEARGFEVLTAPDAAEGLRTLSEELLALDLLVTDVRMPGMDGEELVRTIRTAGGETELAIVAVSARLEPGQEPRLEQAGADAVLDKALGPELIAQAADAVLERKRMVAHGA